MSLVKADCKATAAVRPTAVAARRPISQNALIGVRSTPDSAAPGIRSRSRNRGRDEVRWGRAAAVTGVRRGSKADREARPAAGAAGRRARAGFLGFARPRCLPRFQNIPGMTELYRRDGRSADRIRPAASSRPAHLTSQSEQAAHYTLTIGAMPELPEVETIVRHHRADLIGQRIVDFVSYWPRGVSPGPAEVRRTLSGARIAEVGRRAKYIVLQLEPGRGWLLIHLRMSGRFAWDENSRPAGSTPPRSGRRGRSGQRERESARHVRAVIGLENGRRLLFCDARKFGRIVHTHDYAAFDRSLGPEPLARGFTAARLGEQLAGRARQLKPLLLDQAVVAGLGNIYVDEALFLAGLHPLRQADRLKPAEITRLHAAIRTVLREGIRRQGTTIDWIYPSGRMQERLNVYGRTGEPCTRCGAAIVSLRVGQRGTHICPHCQPKGIRR